jgi:hypothetical protein
VRQGCCTSFPLPCTWRPPVNCGQVPLAC